MGINRAIARLAFLFCCAFALLAVRQLWFAEVAAPRLAADPHNPRAALLAPYRGSIVARDGTILAGSSARGRTYPLAAAAAQAVGYASGRYGTSGLEAAFDGRLSARPAPAGALAQLARIAAHRAAIPVRGDTVVTTLDPRVQSVLFEALRAHARGAGVALDPRTGEVLALASVPSFDPAGLDASFPSIKANPESPLLDRALDGLYPPGSTFKIVTAADALDCGAVTPEDTFEDPGSYAVGSFLVHDDESEATGMQDLTGAFALSSNVDFAQIALKLGADRWFEYAAKWGLGSSLDFTLPAAADHVPAPASVTPSILAQLGFGQADLLVTPLRMALIAATVASGGNEPRPYLVRSVRSADGRASAAGFPATLATPISAETAAAVRALMVAVVRRGTGTSAALAGVQVAGKTGTATNPAGRSHAWFVAFAPAEAPRVAVAIVVENVGYGAAYAAPIARRVIAAALARGPS
jgi:peptidoglycan glycosyltransferase